MKGARPKQRPGDELTLWLPLLAHDRHHIRANGMMRSRDSESASGQFWVRRAVSYQWFTHESGRINGRRTHLASSIRSHPETFENTINVV